jgi:hypothetical protein
MCTHKTNQRPGASRPRTKNQIEPQRTSQQRRLLTWFHLLVKLTALVLFLTHWPLPVSLKILGVLVVIAYFMARL